MLASWFKLVLVVAVSVCSLPTASPLNPSSILGLPQSRTVHTNGAPQGAALQSTPFASDIGKSGCIAVVILNLSTIKDQRIPKQILKTIQSLFWPSSCRPTGCLSAFLLSPSSSSLPRGGASARYDQVHCDEHPIGTNAVVAVITYTGVAFSPCAPVQRERLRACGARRGGPGLEGSLYFGWSMFSW